MQSSKDMLLRISGIVILLSAALHLIVPAVAPWIMTFAVALFSVITVTTPYPGKSIRGKRLFNFQVFSCLLMVVATYLMFRQRNEWVLLMVAGAVFQLYASIVIPKELEKEKNKE
jgi:Na+-translocating ferredoxin:NAD+ oxidoreductase RnfD subunit